MPLWLASIAWRVQRAWTSLTPYGRRVVVQVLAGALCIAVAVLYVWHVRRQRDELQQRVHDLALEASNIKARLDTLRPLFQLTHEDSLNLRLGDSVKVLTRLVVQTKQDRDAIDRALSQSRTAEIELRARVRSLDTGAISSRVPVETSVAGERSASFDVRSTPYTVRESVTLPAQGLARLDSLHITLDTATIAARLGCAERADSNGIRVAHLTLSAPAWLSVTTSRVEQDASVCANASRTVVSERRAWYRPLLVVGYGATYDVTAKRIAHGPTLSLGWRIAF